MNHQKLEKWQLWIGKGNEPGTILRELSDLAVIRTVFNRVAGMVRANPALQQHSTFYSVFGQSYAHTVLMYIRRQVNHPKWKRDQKKSRGLITLAYDLKENASLVTRTYHVDLFTKKWCGPDDPISFEERESRGNASFDSFAEPGGTHLSTKVIEDDIKDLEQIHNEIAGFVDRRLAHLDRSEPDRVPTYGDLERWCDLLDEKLLSYMRLLEASGLRQMAPTITNDWEAIFRVPWLPAFDPATS